MSETRVPTCKFVAGALVFLFDVILLGLGGFIGKIFLGGLVRVVFR